MRPVLPTEIHILNVLYGTRSSARGGQYSTRMPMSLFE